MEFDIESAKRELKKVTIEELCNAGFLQTARRGYICPVCGNGSGHKGTGAETKLGEHGEELLCGNCQDGYDVIDILAAVWEIDVNDPKGFVEVVKRGCNKFGIAFRDGKAFSDRNDQPNYQAKSPEQLAREAERIKRTITYGQKNIATLLKNHGGQQWRGLNRITLEDFFIGYIPDWYARKGAPKSPRVIIPTSFRHYLARLDGKIEDYPIPADAPDGCFLQEKEHRGNKEIFNYKRALLNSDNPVCLVVEGEIDCMSIAQATREYRDGKSFYPVNVIAIGGTNPAPTAMEQLKNLPSKKKFIVLFDNDDAGKKAAPIFAVKLRAFGHQAAVANLSDEYNDANDFLRANPAYLQARIEEILEDTVFDKIAPQIVNLADKYEQLFEGLEPIRPSAGAILHVAPLRLKPALEALLVDKDFVEFQMAANIKDTNILVEWTIVNLFPYFDDNTYLLKSLLVEAFNAAQFSGGLKALDNRKFFHAAIDKARSKCNGVYFDFAKEFKDRLIAFAKHSDNIFRSLLRFTYDMTKDFLQNPFTDFNCAELLVALQRTEICFDTEQGTWYTWQSNHWKEICTNSRAGLYDKWMPLGRKTTIFAEYEYFRLSCEYEDFIIRNPHVPDKSPLKIQKDRLEKKLKSASKKCAEAKTLENSRSMNNYFEVASGLPEIQITTRQLDSKRNLFNCANCTIDLDTMQTYPARQEDLITLATDTVYDPDATSEVWDNFVETLIPNSEMRDWAQRFFGYCLSGSIAEHIFLFAVGIGGAGKTTFLNAISGAIGQYARVFPSDAITENKKQKDGNEPEPILATLKKCRLAISSETKKNKRLDEAYIKLLTGGNTLTARELHKPPFEFKPQFKIVIDGNYYLDVRDINDEGLRRRIRIIPFTRQPQVVDVDLPAKLGTPQTKSAILNWCLEGHAKYQQLGLRDIPATMSTSLHDFYASNDIIADFLADCSAETGDKTIPKFQTPVSVVWCAFQEWRVKMYTQNYKRTDFINAILQAYPNGEVEARTSHNQQWFYGLRIVRPLDYDPPQDI